MRAAIAAQYSSLTPSDILVFCGAEEPIYAFMNVVLQPGDHVIAHAPGYQSHFEIARAIGAEVTLWSGDPERGWTLDPDELRRLVRPKTKLILTSAPHNPTGFLFARDAWQAVIDIAREAGAWLFSDEVYRGLEHDEATRLPAACELYERAVSLDGLSKSYALVGLRVGWLALHDRALYAELAAFKDYLTICNAAPSELLGTIAVENRAYLWQRTRARLLTNLVALDEFFARHKRDFA